MLPELSSGFLLRFLQSDSSSADLRAARGSVKGMSLMGETCWTKARNVEVTVVRLATIVRTLVYCSESS